MARLLAIGADPALVDALARLSGGHEHLVADGNIEALRRIRHCPVDVLVTDPRTSVNEDLALADEIRETNPGVKLVVLAPATTHDDVVASLRARVFACFTAPFDYDEVAAMSTSALGAIEWQHGIEVISGLPHWLTVRVSCRLLTAERLVRFMAERERDLPTADRDLLMTAFREMLVNAMEHGAGFDASKVIEVTAARTERAIVYHFRDPGSGFDRADLAHAATKPTAQELVASAVERDRTGRRPGGFGILLAKQIADELVYNERGNEVLLVKHLR